MPPAPPRSACAWPSDDAEEGAQAQYRRHGERTAPQKEKEERAGVCGDEMGEQQRQGNTATHERRERHRSQGTHRRQAGAEEQTEADPIGEQGEREDGEPDHRRGG